MSIEIVLNCFGARLQYFDHFFALFICTIKFGLNRFLKNTITIILHAYYSAVLNHCFVRADEMVRNTNHQTLHKSAYKVWFNVQFNARVHKFWKRVYVIVVCDQYTTASSINCTRCVTYHIINVRWSQIISFRVWNVSVVPCFCARCRNANLARESLCCPSSIPACAQMRDRRNVSPIVFLCVYTISTVSVVFGDWRIRSCAYANITYCTFERACQYYNMLCSTKIWECSVFGVFSSLPCMQHRQFSSFGCRWLWWAIRQQQRVSYSYMLVNWRTLHILHAHGGIAALRIAGCCLHCHIFADIRAKKSRELKLRLGQQWLLVCV